MKQFWSERLEHARQQWPEVSNSISLTCWLGPTCDLVGHPDADREQKSGNEPKHLQENVTGLTPSSGMAPPHKVFYNVSPKSPIHMKKTQKSTLNEKENEKVTEWKSIYCTTHRSGDEGGNVAALYSCHYRCDEDEDSPHSVMKELLKHTHKHRALLHISHIKMSRAF